jgi:integrase
MPLSDATLRNLKPGTRPRKVFDQGGLFVLVTPAGGKLWRFKYRLGGKEQSLGLGAYPAVGLREARARREEVRQQLAEGKDPSLERKREAVAAAINAQTTFAAVAEEFIQKREAEGIQQVTADKMRWMVAKLAADIGVRPIADIEPIELLHALKRVERLGQRETASRMLSLASRVFRYAVVTMRCRRNIAADLQGALAAPVVKHHAAITDPERLGALLRAIDGFDGSPMTALALKLAPHVFLRPGELRQAEWSEVEFEARVWRVPASKTEMRREHVVPLSRQSLAILNEAPGAVGPSPIRLSGNPHVLATYVGEHPQCSAAPVGVFWRRDDVAWLPFNRQHPAQ